MKTKLPAQCHVQHLIRLSAAEMKGPGADWAARQAEHEGREALAEFVRQCRAQRQDNEHYTEIRLDLYVFTPSEFWPIVNAEAARIALELSRGNLGAADAAFSLT